MKTWVLETSCLGSNLSLSSHQLCDVSKSPDVSVCLSFFICEVELMAAPATQGAREDDVARGRAPEGQCALSPRGRLHRDVVPQWRWLVVRLAQPGPPVSIGVNAGIGGHFWGHVMTTGAETCAGPLSTRCGGALA